MKQIYPLFALAVLLAGGFFFFSNFRIASDDPAGPIVPRQQGDGSYDAPPRFGEPSQPQDSVRVSVPGGPATPSADEFIRIASFNIQVFGESKMGKPDVVNVLADTVRHFDIVAIQEIRAKNQNVLPAFVEIVNAPGYRYDYVIGERLGRTSSKEQYAYIFNTDTIEVDRSTLYTVADPDDLLHREPLVAWFRCRNAPPSETFTFTLVNIHTDPDEVADELNVLDDVFRAVRDDGRREDDVILLGDFNASYRNMGELGQMPNVTFVIAGNLATNTRGTAQYDNIVFDALATQEYLGRGGVFDFMRQYNLTLEEALQVSDHLPVWAEFSIYEGGVPGRVAARTSGYAPRDSQQDERQPRQRSAPRTERNRRPGPADAWPSQPQYTADPRLPGPSPRPPTSRPTTRW